jgi:hypothetical protein
VGIADRTFHPVFHLRRSITHQFSWVVGRRRVCPPNFTFAVWTEEGRKRKRSSNLHFLPHPETL